MRRNAVLTVVAVVVMLSLGACSTGQRVDLGDAASGNLIAAIAGEPDQLDPQKTSAYFSFEVLENVFDTLVEPDETLELRPALATSWDVSNDQLTWIFHLRKGVTFHDGSPFSANDVVYSYRRIIDQHLANAYRFSTVTDISAPDPFTVQIRVTQPTPDLLVDIGGFKGMAIVQTEKRRERPDFDPPDRHRTVRFPKRRAAVTPSHWSPARTIGDRLRRFRG